MKIKVTKKALLSAAFLLVATLFTMPAQAQSREMTLGVGAGYATHNSGGYMNVFFQAGLAPHVRIAPEVGYVFRNQGETAFEAALDVHFPFRLAKGIAIYPLAGVTLNSWKPEKADGYTRVGGDVGAGLDFYLTPNFKLDVQGKYSIMNDCSGGFFGVGLGYVF